MQEVLSYMAEDALVIGDLWAALYYPLVFMIFLVIFLLVMIWLLPVLWRGVKGMYDTLRGFFKLEKPISAS